jgi:hypothetical protein
MPTIYQKYIRTLNVQNIIKLQEQFSNYYSYKFHNNECRTSPSHIFIPCRANFIYQPVNFPKFALKSVVACSSPEVRLKMYLGRIFFLKINELRHYVIFSSECFCEWIVAHLIQDVSYFVRFMKFGVSTLRVC